MPSPRIPVRAASTTAADHAVGDVVGDDERHQGLRQEARLEHASPVLVRDALLAAVSDRLDHGDADVTRRGLDGVHHRLDAVSDDHRLDFHHLPFLLTGPTKKPQGSQGALRRHCHVCIATQGSLRRPHHESL